MKTDTEQKPQPQSLTASARPTCSDHLASKRAKQSERQRLREDRLILRATR